MILRQLLHTNPVVAVSYVFGCGGKGVAAVCDPIDDPHLYLRIAEQAGMKIHYVIDTHIHADHVSGGRTAISDVAHPEWRATAMGAYRFWRDLGYAVGALISGVIADLLGMRAAIQFVAILTLLSGLQVAFRMRDTQVRQNPKKPADASSPAVRL